LANVGQNQLNSLSCHQSKARVRCHSVLLVPSSRDSASLAVTRLSNISTGLQFAPIREWPRLILDDTANWTSRYVGDSGLSTDDADREYGKTDCQCPSAHGAGRAMARGHGQVRLQSTSSVDFDEKHWLLILGLSFLTEHPLKEIDRDGATECPTGTPTLERRSRASSPVCRSMGCWVRFNCTNIDSCQRDYHRDALSILRPTGSHRLPHSNVARRNPLARSALSASIRRAASSKLKSEACWCLVRPAVA
jgi:hypothetical protein